MPSVVECPSPTVSGVEWKPCWRIISTIHPPIAFFERVAPQDDWEALLEVERITNPRYLEDLGKIHLINKEDRRSGPGWGWINGAFTFLNRSGSRFSNGTYGVYYAGREIETAIAETRYHTALFYSRTNEPPMSFTMNAITSNLVGELHDIRGWGEFLPDLYDRDSYEFSSNYGAQLRAAGSYGIVYDSVRHEGGECVAVFRPPVLGEPLSAKNLVYEWDGAKIARVYEKKMIYDFDQEIKRYQQ